MIIWFGVVIALCFGVGALFGAPYLPIRSEDADRLLDLTDIKPGETLLDLGCGDGKLLRVAARRRVYAIGYELNPLVWAIAWASCWRYRRYVTVRFGNYWKRDWPVVDVIYVFLIDRYMAKLDHQLNRRLHQPTRVVSYVFQIPGQSSVRSNKNAWVYIYPNSEN